MKATSLVFVLACIASLGAIGCAEEQAEAQGPELPQAVGYTPPPEVAPQGAAVPAAPVLPPPLPPQPAAPPQMAPPPQDEDSDATDQYADADPSALTDFRSTLDPYGSWVDDPTYGNMWLPSQDVVGQDFTPYLTGGHWAYDDDYTWVSDYDWGWAPFHYGRWVYGPAFGWGWIPGRTYAPAWVSWRYGTDAWPYVGWAPLGPTWCWRGGRAVGLGFVGPAPYTFVATNNLFSPGLGQRVIAGPQVGMVAAHTAPWVPSQAGLAGRTVATPAVGGPPPSTLHLQAASVVRPNLSDRGLVQARAFARPSSAVALGARPPQGFQRASASYRSAEPSHFGGKMGAGFAGNPAYSSPARSYALGRGEARPYYSSPRYSAAGRASVYANSPRYSAPFTGGYHGQPAYTHSASAFPSGGYHPSGGFGGGYHSSGSVGGGFSAGGHSGGGGHGGRR